MRILVTGGAGFVGRWVVKRLLQENDVWVLDNLSNGQRKNLSEFAGHPHYHGLQVWDVRDPSLAKGFTQENLDMVIHMAAQGNVQQSLDNPAESFEVNVLGTHHVLEAARLNKTKVVFVSTCMVYADSDWPIPDDGWTQPSSPYAGTKLAAENLALSYYYGLGLPVTILRPFNTYGPFQKTNTEGGVVSIFIKRNLNGQPLLIYGDGTQSRDLMYVEDCAEFIVRAATNYMAGGLIINAGTGREWSINELAYIIGGPVEYLPHHHPQAEIQHLFARTDGMAKRLLGWEAKVSLVEGIRLTEQWIKEQE